MSKNDQRGDSHHHSQQPVTPVAQIYQREVHREGRQAKPVVALIDTAALPAHLQHLTQC